MNDTMAIQRFENHLIAEEKSAATIEKNRHHSRGRFCDTERQAAEPPEHLAGHEGAVQAGGGSVKQSVSAQPAAPVRPDVLQCGKGHRAAGRPAGAQQHQHHPDLYSGNGGQAQALPGTGRKKAADDIRLIMSLYL